MLNCASAVLFDLDSTIADTRHRQHLLPPVNPESTWDRYAAACSADAPVTGILAAMAVHYAHSQVHIVSGRSAAAEMLTRRWLARHRARYDALRLRGPSGAGAYTIQSNGLMKATYIRQLQAEGVTVLLMYEDNADIAAVIEEEAGIPVVLVQPGGIAAAAAELNPRALTAGPPLSVRTLSGNVQYST